MVIECFRISQGSEVIACFPDLPHDTKIIQNPRSPGARARSNLMRHLSCKLWARLHLSSLFLNCFAPVDCNESTCFFSQKVGTSGLVYIYINIKV